MFERLGRNGVIEIRQGDNKTLFRYFELLTRGNWIYYECLANCGERRLLRFDFENYQVSAPLLKPAVLETLHRYKFVPAVDCFYYLEI